MKNKTENYDRDQTIFYLVKEVVRLGKEIDKLKRKIGKKRKTNA